MAFGRVFNPTETDPARPLLTPSCMYTI
ncbi:uncharacterized protein G2W53_023624 [Senna tora]|uniref:Uncharacterized protein n=1 Tax=Senna tora TaxID=362788 RepID=A0A834TAU3_9FABA|nr:uncharacterized protein G2W53_023624 [Senna tora]